MLTQEEKSKIIKKYKISNRDTGSQEVQIFLLSKEIEKLDEHLKKTKKDFKAKRALLKKVAKRKKFLEYLKKRKPEAYGKIIKEIKSAF